MKKFLIMLTMLLTLPCGVFAHDIALQDESVVDKLIAPYVNDVERIVKANWEKPENESPALISSDKTVVIKFNILRNGEVDSLKIITPSGDKNLDDSVILAVRASAPFKHLPDQYLGHAIEIQMTFESKLLKKQYISPEFFQVND